MHYDPLYIEYLYYFNIAEDFFECHEVMEHLWLEEGRSPLYQGLLQVAVGLHHHQHDNISGAIKLFSAGLNKLKPFLDAGERLGIDLSDVISRSEAYVKGLEREGENWPFSPFQIRITDHELANQVEALRHHPPMPEEEDD